MHVWWVLWIHNASSSSAATIALAQKYLTPTLPILVINLFRVDRKSASLWFVFKVLLFHPWGFHSNLDNLFKLEHPGLSCLHLSSAEILQGDHAGECLVMARRALAFPKESPTHQGDRCVLSPLLSCLITFSSCVVFWTALWSYCWLLWSWQVLGGSHWESTSQGSWEALF